MSAFEVGTEFFNPRSLTRTRFLTWGHNTLANLKAYPFITVKKKSASGYSIDYPDISDMISGYEVIDAPSPVKVGEEFEINATSESSMEEYGVGLAIYNGDEYVELLEEATIENEGLTATLTYTLTEEDAAKLEANPTYKLVFTANA